MPQLLPIFRTLPPILVVFGLVLSIGNIAEVRATQSQFVLDSSFMTTERTIYIVAIIRSMADFLYYTALAALVHAANRFVDAKTAG